MHYIPWTPNAFPFLKRSCPWPHLGPTRGADLKKERKNYTTKAEAKIQLSKYKKMHKSSRKMPYLQQQKTPSNRQKCQ